MDLETDLQAELIARCRKNDRKAQLALYTAYAQSMYATAYGFLKREDAAQDAMQEAFIKAFKHLDSYKETVTFGAWLKRIVVNTCLDLLKKREVKTINMDTSEVVLEDDGNWEVEGSFSADEIVRQIDMLPPKYRLILRLYLLEGYDHQEITQILHINEGTSRSRLMRGKHKLKNALLKSNKNENRHSKSG